MFWTLSKITDQKGFIAHIDKQYRFTNAEHSNHKKEWSSVICSNIDGLREYNASEISQTDKLSFICGIKKINNKTEIDW